MTLDNLLIGLFAGLALLGMQKWGEYGKYVWFDNVAHVLGGVTVASAAGLFFGGIDPYIITFVIGILWELFEWLTDISPWGGKRARDAAWEDTALDMGMVMIGAYIAIEVAKYL